MRRVEKLSRTAWEWGQVRKGLGAAMVNFCVNLTGLQDVQIAGKTLFLSTSFRILLDEISFDLVD